MSSPQPPSCTTTPVNERRRSYSEVAKTPRTRSQSPRLAAISPGRVLEAIASSRGIKESIHSPIPKQASLLDAELTTSSSNKGASGGTNKTNGSTTANLSGTNDSPNTDAHPTQVAANDAMLLGNPATTSPLLPASVAAAINKAAATSMTLIPAPCYDCAIEDETIRDDRSDRCDLWEESVATYEPKGSGRLGGSPSQISGAGRTNPTRSRGGVAL